MPGLLVGTDTTGRLQAIVSGWRGADRGQPVTDLYKECLAAAGPLGSSLLPARVLLVNGLDVATMRKALLPSGRNHPLAFRIVPTGRFDAALVPIGPAGDSANQWLLALDAALPLRDQIALYAHALAHLLLAYSDLQMGKLPDLDPADGRTHVDTLAALQRVEQPRAVLDQRILDAYPILTELLRPREDTASIARTDESDLQQHLAAAGWFARLVQAPHVYTDGRVLGRSGVAVRRGPKARVAALLRAEASLPIGVVQVLRPDESYQEAAGTLCNLARDRFMVPFAFLVAGNVIHAYDLGNPDAVRHTTSHDLPTREELLSRWLASLGLADARSRETLCYPYQLSNGKPRFYQEAAINRAIIAVLQAQRGYRPPRILITQATGTGKTKVAFQIAWKLRKTKAVSNVLFLTDRDTLLGQAMDNDFTPFADARARVLGELVTSRDILFATYQALAGDSTRPPLYKSYPKNFFSLIIVDECHRGSAVDDSNWRAILEWFDQAVQLGLTATPLRTDNVQTYTYFGAPVAMYSLRQGITDGFLAPYKVRRVLMGISEAANGPITVDPQAPPAEAAAPASSTAPAAMLHEEARSVLIDRTSAIAEHLAAYLRDTDPLAKTIVFCVDQTHAERMREAIARASAYLVEQYPDYVERIVADEGQDGKRALGRFQQPGKKTPVVVTTSKLLSTGVDIPTCKNIVLARPVESMVEFKQIIGRGTRLFPPDKTSFTIIDYAGATKYFFDPDFDGDPESVIIDSLIPAVPMPRLEPQPPESSDAGSVLSGATPVAPVSGGDTAPAHPQLRGAEPSAPSVSAGAAGISAPEQPYEPATSEKAVHEGPSAGGGEDASMPAPTPNPGAPQEAAPPTTPAPSKPSEPQSDALSTPPAGANGATPQPESPLITTTQPLGDLPERVRGDGHRVRVIGEVVMELGPDGSTLRTVSYQDYTREALAGLCASPTELRTRWLRPEQQAAVREELDEQGINLNELAAVLGLSDADPFDLLLHVAFGRQALTRAERASRLRCEHADFLARYQGRAREVLDVILNKYIQGQAPDVSDVRLLQVPPLSKLGTPTEIARSFQSPDDIQHALSQLKNLLYTA